METVKTITVESTVKAPVKKVWKLWITPSHVTKWNKPSPDWHNPYTENDVRSAGKFLSKMEAIDGSLSFDFAGIYRDVKVNEVLTYTLDDSRKVKVTFTQLDNQTKVIETFEPESQNPIEMQREGWQSILNSFKQYAETVQ